MDPREIPEPLMRAPNKSHTPHATNALRPPQYTVCACIQGIQG